jgi:N-acetylglutamate synthase-like GNAT family acetyltransferase
MISIIPFEDKYAEDVKRLNLEWLEKYFYVEENDKLQLNNLRSSVLDKGGYIFLAKENEEIIGTVALLKKTADTFELSKMAVTASRQGRGVSRMLMDVCTALAKEKGYKKIFLYSSTLLDAALALYRKYGFNEVPLEQNSGYSRTDIKMELKLS